MSSALWHWAHQRLSQTSVYMNKWEERTCFVCAFGLVGVTPMKHCIKICQGIPADSGEISDHWMGFCLFGFLSFDFPLNLNYITTVITSRHGVSPYSDAHAVSEGICFEPPALYSCWFFPAPAYVFSGSSWPLGSCFWIFLTLIPSCFLILWPLLPGPSVPRSWQAFFIICSNFQLSDQKIFCETITFLSILLQQPPFVLFRLRILLRGMILTDVNCFSGKITDR